MLRFKKPDPKNDADELFPKSSRRGMPVESPPSTSQRRRFTDENHWDREDLSFGSANRLKDGFRYVYELLKGGI